MHESTVSLLSHCSSTFKTVFNGFTSKIDSIGLICHCVTAFVCPYNSIDFCAITAV